MDPLATAYEQLIQHFVTWAKSEENIRAAMIID
jgi:hypothetical protein